MGLFLFSIFCVLGLTFGLGVKQSLTFCFFSFFLFRDARFCLFFYFFWVLPLLILWEFGILILFTLRFLLPSILSSSAFPKGIKKLAFYDSGAFGL